ncbi:protein-L-isoaspartate O-methyltransferase family protein [Phaeospirillum tilakii]|uniref:Protein-L-isoaspartate O-methyltransferase n=1 Tax=Phaeospirillum tilakii TaxID=741673 RepID=A0ABW5CBL4_9PROT
MDFAAARFNMVENQIRTNRIDQPRLLQALAATPREPFLPLALRGCAYADADLPLGQGRVLIQPLVMAQLVQAAAIGPDDVVLAIGDATGWASAVLSRLASTVVALESDPERARAVAARLAEREVDNVAVVEGEFAAGYPAQAPYDAILLFGAVAALPPALPAQLAEHGRLVAVVAPRPGTGAGVRVVRAGAAFGQEKPFDAATAYLPGLGPRPVFRL